MKALFSFAVGMPFFADLQVGRGEVVPPQKNEQPRPINPETHQNPPKPQEMDFHYLGPEPTDQFQNPGSGLADQDREPRQSCTTKFVVGPFFT